MVSLPDYSEILLKGELHEFPSCTVDTIRNVILRDPSGIRSLCIEYVF